VQKMVLLLVALVLCGASVAQAQGDSRNPTRKPAEPEYVEPGEPEYGVDSVMPDIPAPAPVVGRICVTAVRSCRVGPGPQGVPCYCGQAAGRTQ
jgi:hypothetical protein